MERMWYPITIATQSATQVEWLQAWDAETTGDFGRPAGVFQLIDFGFRGVSSVQTAAIGGAAHIAGGAVPPQVGSDNLASVVYGKRFYSGKGIGGWGASIPASERRRADARLTKALKRWASSPRDALNLEGDAPLAAAALQRAYLGLARRCHPDKGGSHRVFLAVKAARDALADDADGPTDPVRPGSEDARYFADDPLFGAVHDDAGYESRFWSDDVASGAGARDRAAMWAKFDADFDARRRAGADAAARPLGVR